MPPKPLKSGPHLSLMHEWWFCSEDELGSCALSSLLCSFTTNNSHGPTNTCLHLTLNSVLSPIFLTDCSLLSHRVLANNKWNITTSKFITKSLFTVYGKHPLSCHFVWLYWWKDNISPPCVLTHGRPSLNFLFNFFILPHPYIPLSCMSYRRSFLYFKNHCLHPIF